LIGKYYYTLKKLQILLLLSLIPLFSSATHLIGGEITYTCLGNNQYEIKLTIYVDCGPTNTLGTGFDIDGLIAIYDNNNNLYEYIDIFNPQITELSDETVGNDCFELPTGLCIKQGIYTTTVNLPPIPGGYQIAYQRCCRNPSINNIDIPEFFGSTFTTHIPGSDETSECNSSPTFNSYPPLALCLGDDINVDLSAIDADGDSLVYELTTPFHGANDVDPTEITPPPFTPIIWVAGFSASYPMNSDPAIAISSTSGMITGTPTSMGMSTIGVKVSEYRDGIRINEIIRDFCFLVVDCNVTTASFPLSNWYCNSLTVEFLNDSYNADTYLWDFGDNGATSTLFEPNHTYPDTGMYTASLIANPNTVCADTNTVTFPLYTELLPYFENPDPQCVDNNSFDLFGEGTTPPGTIFTWNFGANATPSTSNVLNPTGITFPEVGTYPISYNLQYNDCDETYLGTLAVFDEDIFPEVPDLSAQCFDGNSFDFTAEGTYPNQSTFLWDFGSNANPQTSTQQNPTNIQFLNPGTHNISLSVYANGCDNSTENSINIHEPFNLNITATPLSGCEPVNVDFNTNLDGNNYTFDWDLGNDNTANTNIVSETYMAGNYEVTLVAVDKITNCSKSVSLNEDITVVPQPISEFTLNADVFILGDPILITNNAQHANSLTYEFSTGYTSNEESPEYMPPSTGDLTIWQYAINEEFGCIDSSSVETHVDYEYTFWTPNSFTPNGDLLNDNFSPVYKRIKEYRLQIFNRWGQLIFDESGENPKWNGNFYDGTPCTIDSYVYLINYKGLDGSWHKTKGVVNLIR